MDDGSSTGSEPSTFTGDGTMLHRAESFEYGRVQTRIVGAATSARFLGNR